MDVFLVDKNEYRAVWAVHVSQISHHHKMGSSLLSFITPGKAEASTSITRWDGISEIGSDLKQLERDHHGNKAYS